MSINDFVGADAKMRQLMRSAQAGRIVHALLFTGPRGTGKKTMANLFAQTLLCTSEVGQRPCGVCPACKKCLAGAHMDVHRVAPEKNTIKVDQIRELIAELSLTAHDGGKKIAIIERADAMNESAQNALLKTLENPTGDVLFILLTESAGALLPTIQSRCLQSRFSCIEVEACARAMRAHGAVGERALLSAALAQGSVGRALEIFADDAYFALRTRAIDAVESLRHAEDVQRAVAAIGDARERRSDILEILELWARDLMRVQNGASPIEQDKTAALQSSKLCGSDLLRAVMRVRQLLQSNVSWTGAMESGFFALVEA